MRTPLLLGLLCLTGCDVRTPGTRAKAIASFRASNPLIVQFDRLFPKGQHGIFYYSGAFGQPRWNSKVTVDDRYKLSLSVDVNLDRSGTVVTPKSRMSFSLLRIRKVEQLPDGRTYTSYFSKGSGEFDVEEWNKVVHANGDLSVIQVQPHLPEPGPEEYALPAEEEELE